MHNALHLSIPEPCHENWQQMTPQDKGRHCHSCQKTVVDFTGMSDQEVLQYIAAGSSNICGRFHSSQLNKTYSDRVIKTPYPYRYAWNMLFSGALLGGAVAEAQTKLPGHLTGLIAVAGPQHIQRKPVSIPDRTDKVNTLAFTANPLPWELRGDPRRTALEPLLKLFANIRDGRTHIPIAGAAVRMKGVKDSITTDALGQFAFPLLFPRKEITLQLSAPGYSTQEYTITVNSFRTVELYLDRIAGDDEVVDEQIVLGEMMGKVVLDTTPQPPPTPPSHDDLLTGVTAFSITKHTAPVNTFIDVQADTMAITADSLLLVSITAPPLMGCEEPGVVPPVEPADTVFDNIDHIYTGTLVVKRETTRVERFKREIQDWMPAKKDIKCYPNPVVRGHAVNLNLQLKRTGAYKLELMDAGGRIVHLQAIQVSQSPQVISLPTQPSWSSGVYWVRITSHTDKKVYQARLLLQ